MPRDAVALTTLTQNGGTLAPAGVTITPANGANIAAPTAPSSDNSLFLYITNTAGADKVVTIKAGVSTAPSTRGGTGDLAFTVTTAAGAALIGPLETNRFAQTDGTINVDFASGLTGKITAYISPTRW